MLFRNSADHVEQIPVLLVVKGPENHPDVRRGESPPALVGRALVFFRIESPRERGDQTSTPSPKRRRSRNEFPLGRAPDQRPLELDGLVAVGLQPIRDPERPRRRCYPRVVGANRCTEPSPLSRGSSSARSVSSIATLSVLHVHLIEVDHVRLQAAKRSLAKPVMIALRGRGPNRAGPGL